MELDAAGVGLARSEQLLKDRAGNARSVDEARARPLAAEAALPAAGAGLGVLKRAPGGGGAGPAGRGSARRWGGRNQKA